MLHKNGKRKCSKLCNFSLDKLLELCYNGIAGQAQSWPARQKQKDC